MEGSSLIFKRRGGFPSKKHCLNIRNSVQIRLGWGCCLEVYHSFKAFVAGSRLLPGQKDPPLTVPRLTSKSKRPTAEAKAPLAYEEFTIEKKNAKKGKPKEQAPVSKAQKAKSISKERFETICWHLEYALAWK